MAAPFADAREEDPMKCPRCGQTLESTRYEGVSIETCRGCGGEWLDKFELKAIVQSWEKEFTPEEIQSLEAIDEADFTLDPRSGDARACPRCPDTRLERFNYAATSGIALDKCPSCGGIWFDKDELEKVQILSEEWNKKLGEDMERFGDLYQKVSTRTESTVDHAASVSRFGVFNAILRRLF